jgi:hypothetical protein
MLPFCLGEFKLDPRNQGLQSPVSWMALSRSSEIPGNPSACQRVWWKQSTHSSSPQKRDLEELSRTTGLGLPSITLSIARKARHRPWGPYQEGNQGVRRAASMRMCEQGLFAHGVLI